jgi:hypothetical protein
MRSLADKNTITNNIRDPYVKENILSPDEIQELIALYHQQDNKIQKNTGPVTSDITDKFNNIPVLQRLQDRIKAEVGECRIYTSFFFKVNAPHVIHNDDDKLGPIVYKAFTIPLEIEYVAEPTGYPYLCFFDQFYLEGPAKFFRGSKINIPTYYNTQVYEYNDVQNKSLLPFDQAVYDKHLTHLKDFWLRELSFQSAQEWKPGNAIVFDCVRLHCASNFVKQGIKSKLGLSVFTALN